VEVEGEKGAERIVHLRFFSPEFEHTRKIGDGKKRGGGIQGGRSIVLELRKKHESLGRGGFSSERGKHQKGSRKGGAEKKAEIMSKRGEPKKKNDERTFSERGSSMNREERHCVA